MIFFDFFFLAFVCTICGPKAIFPTSPFSKIYPSNYSLNKKVLPLLGPSGYFHLLDFLQNNQDNPQEITTKFSNQKPKLLVPVDNTLFDFSRPFDPPLPTDPDANIMFGASTQTISNGTKGNSLKLKDTNDLKAPANSAQMNSSTLKPMETKTNGSTNNDKKIKIKACPELPLGCRLIPVAPGTKLVSKNVAYSTTEKTGLTAGCYRVKEPDKQAERIVIIKDDKNFSHAVAVTDIGREHKQIEVSKYKSKTAVTTSKKSKKKKDESSEEEDSEEESEDDSDDSNWGSSRQKRKKVVRGKNKRKK